MAGNAKYVQKSNQMSKLTVSSLMLNYDYGEVAWQITWCWISCIVSQLPQKPTWSSLSAYYPWIIFKISEHLDKNSWRTSLIFWGV